MPEQTVLSIHALSVRFNVGGGFLGRGRKVLRAVEDFSLDVRRGETIGIVGESGCGKSTLARALMGLAPIRSGSVRFFPRDRHFGPAGIELAKATAREWSEIRRRVQIVFQDPFSSLSPKLTVGRIIAEPLEVHGTLPRALLRKRVEELMELVGLSPADRNRYPHEFSGGQRQRIMIARAIALDPEVLIADEAVSALDVSIRLQIIRLLEELKERLGLTLIFISHDLSVVRAISDRVAIMYLGRPVELGDAETIFAGSAHPYTQMLIRATPVPDPDQRMLHEEIRGELPSPIAPPPGCSFHPRCRYADAICTTRMPDLSGHPEGEGHAVRCHHAEAIPALLGERA